MALTPVLRVRYKTSRNETLLPDGVIEDFIAQNTADGVWNFELTVADVFDYLASESNGETLKSWSRGNTSETYSQTFTDAAAYWRGLGGGGGARIVVGHLTRADYDATTGTEYGGAG